eukprot:TRINITY_DN113760_c0_g1_i1.p1 TRINITY_DN113760_c0_g1~~TRINITY_DN113760_c0_g1_i1.p1  ORF type:complete len:417 (+),score=16.99 TRINITY_DN113760_c0_g1_i1:45-1295(+)
MDSPLASGEWGCPQCTLHNPSEATQCRVCDWVLPSDCCRHNPLGSCNRSTVHSHFYCTFHLCPVCFGDKRSELGTCSLPVCRSTPATISGDDVYFPELRSSSRQSQQPRPAAPSAPPAPASVLEQTNVRQSARAQVTCDCPLCEKTYVKVRFLQNGGMHSKLYIAHHKDTPQKADFVLKEVSFQSHDKCDTAYHLALTVEQIQHKNVIQYTEVFQHTTELGEKILVIIMPYVPAGDLTALLTNATPMAVLDLLDIAHQVSIGLAHLHHLTPSFVHRDLKPENVLWDGKTARLSDLEASRLLIGGQAEIVQGPTGTFPYQPPEQVARGQTSVKSDVWSAGCLFYVLATKPEWTVIMHTNIQQPGFKDEMQRKLAHLPAKFTKLLFQMLEIDPDKRPPALDVRDNLELIMREERNKKR